MSRLRKQGPGPGRWPVLGDVGGLVAGSEPVGYDRVGDSEGAPEASKYSCFEPQNGAQKVIKNMILGGGGTLPWYNLKLWADIKNGGGDAPPAPNIRVEEGVMSESPRD